MQSAEHTVTTSQGVMMMLMMLDEHFAPVTDGITEP